MLADYHVCRRARREDISRSACVWAKHRPLYEPEVWASFPALLEDLLDRDLATFAVVEALPRGEPRLFGGIGFIRPEIVAEGRAGPSTIPNCAMRAALGGRAPFLSLREVAEANARGGLHLLVLFGHIDPIDLGKSEMADFYRASSDGFRFFVSGHSLRAMWAEVSPSHHVQELQEVGMQIDRRVLLADGSTSTLLRLTSEEALANPYPAFASYFFPPKPRFGFSLGEQRLLEYALLEASDQEAAGELHVSDEAVKKRWRSIYAKIDTTAPDLLAEVTSGAARRRTVLHYLRRHLEELRPYREARPAGQD